VKDVGGQVPEHAATDTEKAAGAKDGERTAGDGGGEKTAAAGCEGGDVYRTEGVKTCVDPSKVHDLKSLHKDKGGEQSTLVEEKKKAKAKPLAVTTRYRCDGAESEHLLLKITLPVSWDSRTCTEAIVEPFMRAYAKKRPAAAPSTGTFAYLRVESWGGPRPCASDALMERPHGRAEPQHVLLPCGEPVSALRDVARISQVLFDVNAISVELVQPTGTALALAGTPTRALMCVGEKLNAMLSDIEAGLAEMHSLVDATLARGEMAYRALVTARDALGRTPLHNCVTRGDMTLCRKLARTEDAALAVDNNRDSALTIAALAGRQLIVRELLRGPAARLLREKNRDLMTPLQMACVDEAQGNGEVARLLVEAGAPVDEACWDVSPLMAAAAGGHHWVTQTLLELGADVHRTNGLHLAALDYARDETTAAILCDYLEERLLPDEQLLRRAREARHHHHHHHHHRQRGQAARATGEEEDRGPRLFQSLRTMPLEEAFAHLLPDGGAEGLAEFRARGAHVAALRQSWRTLVLRNHPDKLGHLELGEQETQRRAAAFANAMGAFEAIDAFYADHHAPPAPEAARDAGATPAEASVAAAAAQDQE